MNNRKSARLKGYDYASEGGYFITINAKQRKVNHFGKIENGKMIFNEAGLIVQNEWLKTTDIRAQVSLDEFVVMPDHFHAVLFLTETQSSLRQKGECSSENKKGECTSENKKGECNSPIRKESVGSFKSPSQTVGAIVRGFKSACTKKFNETKLRIEWQRNYYDIIIRNEMEYLNIQNYIKNNPSNWKE